MPLIQPGPAPVNNYNREHSRLTRAVVLSHEDPDVLQALAGDYFRRCQPIDEPERHQVEKIVSAVWRQRRLWAIETTLLEIEMSNTDPEYPLQADPGDVRLAKAFRGQSTMQQALDRLSKMESQLDSMAARAERTLRSLQQNRRKEPEPKVPAPPQIYEIEPEPSPLLDPSPAKAQNERNEPESQPAALQICEIDPKPAPHAVPNLAGIQNERNEPKPPLAGDEPEEPERIRLLRFMLSKT